MLQTRTLVLSLAALALTGCDLATNPAESTVAAFPPSEGHAEEPAGASQQELKAAENFELALAEELADVGAALDVFIRDREANAPVDDGARDDGEAGEPEATCVATVGTCNVCTTVDGGWFGGSFAVETTPTPCGYSDAGANWSVDWTVLQSSVAGTWTPTVWYGGSYDVSIAGVRTTEFATSSALGSNVSSADWDILASASIINLELVSTSISLEVDGFAGGVWTVDVTADPSGVYGTASAENDLFSCTVSGVLSAPTVSCVSNVSE